MNGLMNLIYGKAYDAVFKMNGNATFASRFAKMVVFLKQNPNQASYKKGGDPFSDVDIPQMASRFVASRMPQRPSMSATIPDSMVAEILVNFYKVPQQEVDLAIRTHLQAMGAENIIGYLLESYIASVVEPAGWVWCSGSFIKAIDFIKPDAKMLTWKLLQVKNRDNSENSSSAAIRSGTPICKWFRTYSRTGKSNWENFPDSTVLLSEEFFTDFVKKYLSELSGE